jgi:tetrahydromethanopterin S-methyltransferase subunit A
MTAETSPSWPVLDGKYIVGDPAAPVAACVLTSERLAEPLARIDGVAIAGQVYTANLGIERIVVNVTANPAIRFLMLCGKDSKIFRPGQSLSALLDDGVDGRGRIVGAEGYDPVLPELPVSQIDLFRQQVEIVDLMGEEDVDTLRAQIGDLAARAPGKFTGGIVEARAPARAGTSRESFVSIRPGGKREPLQYDPKGYFVITLDRDEEQIVVRHYLPNHTSAHEMRGRVATSLLLGLIREGLISQLSHAGYLGEELAKAEAALRLDLRYDQDRPVRRMPQETRADESAAGPAAEPAAPPMPRITPPLTRDQLLAAPEGETVSVTLEIIDLISDAEFGGKLLEPAEKDPFSTFERTDHRLTVRTTDETKTVMGAPSDVVVGAIVRVSGPLQPKDRIEARGLVILTNVATVQ